MTTVQVTVVNGSYNTNSTTGRLAGAIGQSLSEQCSRHEVSLDVTVVNLIELAADLFERLTSDWSVQCTPRELQEAIVSVTNTDLLLVASPIYKASYTGLFKVFFDLLGQNSLREKPVLVCAAGGSDEHRLALDSEMRMLFSFFCAQVLPVGVYSRPVDFMEDGSLAPALSKNIAQATESAYRHIARVP